MPNFSENICPVCSSDRFSIIGSADLGDVKIEKKATRIVKCDNCKSYYANPMPQWTADDFEILYGNSYFGGEHDDDIYDSDFKRIRRENVEYRFKIISRHLRSNENTMLEIGAGIQAYMAKYLLEKKWGQVVVQEPSSAISQMLSNQNPGLTIISNGFLEISLPKFSLIYADSVLEHTSNPRDYMRHVADLLVPGGGAYFIFPNEHSFFNYFVTLANGLLGKKFVKYLCPYTDSYHLIGFSRRGIKMMANEVGLELVIHFKGRDHSWDQFIRLNRSPFLKFPAAAIFYIADLFGFGRNQEVFLRKPSNLV